MRAPAIPTHVLFTLQHLWLHTPLFAVFFPRECVTLPYNKVHHEDSLLKMLRWFSRTEHYINSWNAFHETDVPAVSLVLLQVKQFG